VQAAQHGAKDPLMEPKQQVPVQETDVSSRVKDGRLAYLHSSGIALDFELQPESARELYLGAEQ
jgi:hypothetical protein